MRRTIAAAAAVLILTGCSGNTNTNEPTQSQSPTAHPVKAAGEVVNAMKPHIKQATAVKVWTPETDPNQLMGRPGQYVSSATLVDSRTACTDAQPGVDCGATVEVFASEAEAAQRAAYIDSILKGSTMLGTEYHTLEGATLLRVTGKLPPAQNEVYAAAFRDAL